MKGDFAAQSASDIIIDQAQRGESCIFCSYEMSQLELFSKSLARELFKRVPSTDLTAADIRRGAHSLQLANIINDFSNSKLNLSILELQDESIDELLSLLKPFCYDKAKKQQPRQIQLKCLKNRQGNNYDCFFNYFSTHDCFTPCEKFGDNDKSSDNSSFNDKL